MGPLGNLTVIDASWGMPGSVATLLLADCGANVIKVERPGPAGEPPGLLRLAWERGKKSLQLDLAATADRQVLDGLLARADVFVESFGAGRAAPLGLDYPTLARRFPRLVCCGITGYGQRGPWRDEPGYDCLVAAKMGVMTEQPSAGREGPIFLGHPHICYGTGFMAAIGILAAIRARHLTGCGQFVDVSLLDGLLSQSPMNWWHHPSNISYVETQGGQRTGFGRKRLITAAFECGDGEFIQVHTGGQGGFKATMEIFGFGDITQTITGRPEMSVPLDDEEFVIAREYIPEAFKQRPRQEWIELFEAADLAVLPVLRQGEVLQDEQVLHAGRVMTHDHPQLGRIRQSAPPLRFGQSQPPLPSPPPRIGEHSDELRRLAATAPPAAVPAAGSQPLAHPLKGIRVLDFASFFATPYGAKLLSDLGADVIMVEAPSGEQMRSLPNPFEAAQRGKRNIMVDLKTDEGRRIVHELVATADVVMHNQRPGKAEKIGIGYETLAKINPKLLYVYLPGFGSSGPKAHRKSFAPLVSGFTGLLYEAAGEGNKPVRSAEGNEDYYNGLIGAVAVLAGLEQRARTGEGQYIESPQLHSSLFTSSHHFLGPHDEPLTALPMDGGQMGWGPLYRLYQTEDDWICIACVGNAAFVRLAAALGLAPGLSPADPDALAQALAARFAQMKSADAFRLLREHHVACEVPAHEPQMPKLFFADWALEQGLVVEQPESLHGPIREIGLYVRLSDTPGQHKGPAPRPGQHTREILRELGCTDERIAALSDAGAVVLDAGPK